MPIPIVLSIKAGPALLQKARSREASDFEISLSLYKDAQTDAPIGYPLIIPRKSGENEASPSEKAGFIIPLNVFWRGLVSFRFEISFVRTRKGNSDGITDFMHNSIASMTALLTTDGT